MKPHPAKPAAKQVAKEISKRVDGPANCDDLAHVVEGSCDSLRAAIGVATRLAIEDLVDDEAPSGQTSCKASPPAWGREHINLACIAKGEHDNCANQELPESS